VIRRLIAAVFVVGACAAAVLMTGATEQAKTGSTIKIAFDNAFGLTKGGDLRMGSVKAGKTSGFDISKGPACQGAHPQGPPRSCAIVTGEVDVAGFGSFRRDAHCDIRQQSLIGEYYVDCQPGTSPQAWPKNQILPVTQTTSTIPTDLVQNILRRPYRDRLRLLIAELGTGLAGRPEALAEVLRRADPGLRETQKTLKILANQNQIIKNFITNSDTVVNQLDNNKRELARWVTSARIASEVSATRQSAITEGFRKFPTFLSELKPTMTRLNELTVQQRPLLADLQRAAPDLTTFFKELGPFSEASRPAFRSLGGLSTSGLRAVRDSSDEIATLRQFAKDAPGVGKPLRQFLQVADDRNRERHWPDVRAMETAPPAPDPTSDARGKSFTGMESFWNYIFWQGQAINEFDTVGHYLRILAQVGTECGVVTGDARPIANGGTAKSQNLGNLCNSYMGPYQPGINTRDPTDKNHIDDGSLGGKSTTNGTAKVGNASSKNVLPKANSLDSKVGQPAATTPLPGQIDPSQPHVVMPPQLQELMNSLSGKGPSGPSSLPTGQSSQLPNGAPSSDQLLGFLLSP
jgi:phospholipid/cholesterol/gamma-HCH transport system substrate-binding protein